MGESSVKTKDYTLEEWSERWRNGTASWHKEVLHPKLDKYWDRMIEGRKDVNVFVPLCGKAVDLKWMHDQGHRVVGLEFDEIVVRELFQESQIPIHEIRQCGDLKLFLAKDERFKCYQGDFFAFNPELEEEKMEAIWDRGSLVAINKGDRQRYASIVKRLMSPSCRYLLDSFTYDEREYQGVPRSIADEEIQALFTPECKLELLEREEEVLSERWLKEGLTRREEKIHLITKA